MKIKDIKFNSEYLSLKVEFEHNGKKGNFIYELFGQDRGIVDCEYNEEDEDIYQEIHDFIEKNIEKEIKVWYKGKRLK